jgi:hypothetical protein
MSSIEMEQWHCGTLLRTIHSSRSIAAAIQSIGSIQDLTKSNAKRAQALVGTSSIDQIIIYPYSIFIYESH